MLAGLLAWLGFAWRFMLKYRDIHSHYIIVLSIERSKKIFFIILYMYILSQIIFLLLL